MKNSAQITYEFFSTPEQIANCNDLSPNEKIVLLRQWSYDQRENQISAHQHNAIKPLFRQHSNLLCRIHQAIIKLHASNDLIER